jgi:hypothetical protein
MITDNTISSHENKETQTDPVFVFRGIEKSINSNPSYFCSHGNEKSTQTIPVIIVPQTEIPTQIPGRGRKRKYGPNDRINTIKAINRSSSHRYRKRIKVNKKDINKQLEYEQQQKINNLNKIARLEKEIAFVRQLLLSVK